MSLETKTAILLKAGALTLHRPDILQTTKLLPSMIYQVFQARYLPVNSPKCAHLTTFSRLWPCLKLQLFLLSLCYDIKWLVVRIGYILTANQ